MNPARLHEAVRNLNGAAIKVLNAVPLNEAWPVHDIYGELVRLGVRTDHRVLQGCLGALKHDGLIKEPQPGSFVRVLIPKALTIVNKPTPTLPAPTLPPLERLAALSRSMSSLADLALDLSKEIDDTVDALKSSLTSTDADLQKLRQLQAMLKGMVT